MRNRVLPLPIIDEEDILSPVQDSLPQYLQRMRNKLHYLHAHMKTYPEGSKERKEIWETIIYVERVIERETDKMYARISDLTDLRDRLQSAGKPFDRVQELIDEYEAAISFVNS